MRLKFLSAGILTLLALTGCTSQQALEQPSNTVEGALMERSAASADISAIDRSVIRSAYITLETEDFTEAVTEVERIVQARKGFLDNWSRSSNDAGEAWAYFATIRVPNTSLDQTLAELQVLGNVTQLELVSSDVTTQVLDFDARIKSLTESIDRLGKLLESATTTSELIEIENALAQRQAELESLQVQSDYLNSQVDYSTIGLSLYLKDRGPQAEPQNFLEGIQYGFEALVAFFAGSLVTAGYVVPWLILFIPMALVAIFLIRRLVKRVRIRQ
jgi:hypothetical protein